MVRTLLSIVAAAATSAVCLWSQQTVPAQPTQTISLPGVKGNFDHFGVDSAHGRLFATLQAERLVEVFESSSGRKIGTMC
jgi:hypothetical protein